MYKLKKWNLFQVQKLGNVIGLSMVLCICGGLLMQALAKYEKIFFILLILSAFLVNKKRMNLVLLYLVLGGIIMIRHSSREIPNWGARTQYIGTDSVWVRNNGYVDVLISTLIRDKKCIMRSDCWYYNYVNIFAKEIVTDYEYELISNQDTFSEWKERFQQVGWMHLEWNSLLLNEKAYQHCSDGDEEYLYVNPVGLSDTETVIILNDEEGNIYIESEDEWKKE